MNSRRQGSFSLLAYLLPAAHAARSSRALQICRHKTCTSPILPSAITDMRCRPPRILISPCSPAPKPIFQVSASVSAGPEVLMVCEPAGNAGHVNVAVSTPISLNTSPSHQSHFEVFACTIVETETSKTPVETKRYSSWPFLNDPFPSGCHVPLHVRQC